MAENDFTKRNKQNGLPSQQILDAGLNVFGLQLLIESFTDLAGDNTTPLKFKYLGVNIRLQVDKPENNKPIEPTGESCASSDNQE